MPADAAFAAFQLEDSARSAPTKSETRDAAEWLGDGDEALTLFEPESPTSPAQSSENVHAQSAIDLRHARLRVAARAIRQFWLSAGLLMAMVFGVTPAALRIVDIVKRLAPFAREPELAADPPVVSPAAPPVARPPLSRSVDPIASGNDDPLATRSPRAAVSMRQATDRRAEPAPRVLPPLSVASRATTVDVASNQAPLPAPPDRIPTPESIVADSSPTESASHRSVRGPEQLVDAAAELQGAAARPPLGTPTRGTLPPSFITPINGELPGPLLASLNVTSPETVIQSVLNRYAAAFSGLDVHGAKAVWPSVNERGLAKAFATLEQQQFDLGTCTIAVTASRAVATCNGTAQYIPRIGHKRPQSNRRRWMFELQQHTDGWSIETVNSR
jgi:hypothetical protein